MGSTGFLLPKGRLGVPLVAVLVVMEAMDWLLEGFNGFLGRVLDFFQGSG